MSNPFKPEVSGKTDSHVTNPRLLADSHGSETKHQVGPAEKSALKSNSDKLIAQNTDAPKLPQGVVKWESDNDPDSRARQFMKNDGKPKVIIFKLVGCAPCKQLQDSALTEQEKTYGDKINFYEVVVGDPKQLAANATLEAWFNPKENIRYPHIWYYNKDMTYDVLATEGNRPQEVKDKVAKLLAKMDK